jgi:predicted MFS family arabinose efflux permease
MTRRTSSQAGNPPLAFPDDASNGEPPGTGTPGRAAPVSEEIRASAGTIAGADPGPAAGSPGRAESVAEPGAGAPAGRSAFSRTIVAAEAAVAAGTDAFEATATFTAAGTDAFEATATVTAAGTDAATGTASAAGADGLGAPEAAAAAGPAGTSGATDAAPDAGAAARPDTISYPPLRRNARFQILWAGSAATALGVTVADVAYPLAILAVTGSPAKAGAFASIQAAAMIAAGLPAGHLVDRHDPRRVLIAVEACRAAVTGLVAAALATGWLTFPLLVVAAALLGMGQPAVSSARLLLIRTVVPPPQLTRALTQDEIRINGADLVGPPLGGAMYSLRALSHAVPFVFIAFSMVVSLVAATLVKVARPAAPPGGGADGKRSGILAGVLTIWRNPVLRATALLIATVNSVGGSLGLVVVVLLRSQSVSPAMIGVTLAAGSIGGLAGASLVKPLHRLQPGVLLISVCLIDVPLLALLAVPAGPWWMAGLLFLAMLTVPSIRVLLDVLILRQAPPSERGRVVGAVMTLMGAGIPVGLAVAGVLLQYLSARTTMLLLVGALCVGVLYCSMKPALWRARWPQ